jgi:hypothetical protein
VRQWLKFTLLLFALGSLAGSIHTMLKARLKASRPSADQTLPWLGSLPRPTTMGLSILGLQPGFRIGLKAQLLHDTVRFEEPKDSNGYCLLTCLTDPSGPLAFVYKDSANQDLCLSIDTNYESIPIEFNGKEMFRFGEKSCNVAKKARDFFSGRFEDLGYAQFLSDHRFMLRVTYTRLGEMRRIELYPKAIIQGRREWGAER